MLKFEEMDENTKIYEQMQQKISPVILINKFTVVPQETEQLIAAWALDAAFMKQQPGYISTQLHRGIGDSSVFINYAIWENMESFRQAFNHPEFKRSLQNYPSSTIASPHLFQRISVPGICLGDN